MGDFSRRDVMNLFAGTAASIALIEAGLLTPANAARNFVTASAGGAWGEHIDQIYIKDGGFKALTKLDVSSSYQLESVAASKIIASKGAPPFDVSCHGQSEVAVMHEAGALLSYVPSLVPNLADVPDTAKMGDHYCAMNFLLFGLVWNTKEIAKAPATFEDLLNPAYKGRIGIPAYGWYGMNWLHGVNKALGGTEDNIDPGIKFAAQAVKKNNAIIIENADHARKMFGQGEMLLCPFWNGIASQLARSDVPVKFESVPGTLGLGTGFVIAKGTPHEEAANKFVNLTLRPDLQVKFSSWNLYPPTNRKAKMPAELESIAITDAQLANTVQLDWKKVVAHRADYLKRWNEEVLS